MFAIRCRHEPELINTIEDQLYASGYDDKAIDQWATRVASWARGKEPADAEKIMKDVKSEIAAREVFVYFDNDVKVRAPFDAQQLMARTDAILSQPETSSVKSMSAD